MADEHHQLEVKLIRRAIVDGRQIHGIQYRNEFGNLAWHITSWVNDPIDHYWVEGGEFYEMIGLDYAVNFTPMNRITTGAKIIEMEPAKRNVILDAIQGWELGLIGPTADSAEF